MMHILAGLSGVLFINGLINYLSDWEKTYLKKKRLVLFQLKPIHVCCMMYSTSNLAELTFKYADL